MKILIDAMGGDNAPLCVLQGAAQAAAEFGDGMTLALLGAGPERLRRPEQDRPDPLRDHSLLRSGGHAR